MKFDYHNGLQPKINAEKNRCYYVPTGKNTDYTPLNSWKFAYFPDFCDEAFTVNPVTEIKTPSCWQMLGYGKHQYTNIRYPFPYTPPVVLGENPCGVYVTEYKKTAAEKQYIVFEGVDSAYYLLVNGEFVGFATISHNMTEFDITPYLKDVNEIRVVVLKNNASSYLEDQDKFRMSGIFRSVYVLGRPSDHIRDYKIVADVSGEVKITADAPADFTLFYGDKKLAAASGESVTLNVANPKLWSAETPELYALVIEYNGERIDEAVGFRKIEIKGKVFYVNGKPVKLKGVNRHSSTVNGFAETHEDYIKDLTLFKANNINAVRTSHYPPTAEFTKLCDKYGIYVLEEADIESHGTIFRNTNDATTRPRNEMPEDGRYLPQFKERIFGMYERDKNRPSVIIWSLGNESGWGKNFAAVTGELHKKDGRPIHYENAYDYTVGKFVDGGVLDMHSRMYPSVEDIEKFLASEQSDRPYVLCEYTHAMGNSSGDVKAYWDCIYAHPEMMGAFVWEWCDHAIKTDKGWLYGGDFGEDVHDGNFCVDGLVTPDRRPKSSLNEVKKVYSPFALSYDGKSVKFKNNYDFKTFTGKLRLTVKQNGVVAESKEYEIIEPAGEAAEIPFAVKAKGGFVTLICETLAGADEPLLHEGYVLDKTGFTVCNEKINATPTEEIGYKLGRDGNIISLTAGGNELLASGFKVDIFRAYTDNDMPYSADFNEKGLKRCKNYLLSLEDGKITGVIAANAHYPLLEYTLCYSTDGKKLKIKFDYTTKSNLKFLPRVGLTFALKGDENVIYLGKGEGESYKDKCNYTVKDYYAYETAACDCPYIYPQEYGNHTDTDYVKFRGCGLTVTADRAFNFSALPYSEEALENAKHDFELTKDGNTYVHLDADSSGVGSHSCGPELSESAKAARSGNIEFTLCIER